MENIIGGLVANELEILDREGVEYTVINATQVDYYNVYDVRIEGKDLDVERAQDVLYRAAIY